MTKARILRDKYEEDLRLLQENCPHTETEILPYYWAPGHGNGTCKYCVECEFILEHYPDYPEGSEIITEGKDEF